MHTPYSLDPIAKLPVRFLKAKKVRVKSLSETRFKTSGGLCCRGWFHDSNMVVFAGEIGELRFRLFEGNGWDQLELVAEFTAGRVLPLAELVRPDDGGPTADLNHGVWRARNNVEKNRLAVVRE